MEKPKKKGKSILGVILLIMLSFSLIFLVIWLGFSFFSMRSESPYVKPLVDLEGEEIKRKVIDYIYEEEGNKYLYSFVIVVEDYKEDTENYYITAIPYKYDINWGSRNEARFEYTLRKSKGKYDFSELEWDQPLLLTLGFRIDEDFEYLLEYGICSVEKLYSNTFDKGNPYMRDSCVVKRDVQSWEIEVLTIGEDLHDMEGEFNES